METKIKPISIFVVGTPRSGTTLVASILGQHSDVFAPAPGETHYFHYFHNLHWQLEDNNPSLNDATLSDIAKQLLKIFGDRGNIAMQKIVDTSLNREILLTRASEYGGGSRGLYLAFTYSLAEAFNKCIYCDDTPKHIFCLQEIFLTLPESRVIACVRDPRDYLASYKNYWRTGFDPGRTKQLYHPILTSLLWRASMNILLRQTREYHSDRLLVVQYEKLVRHPQSQTKRIIEFLGLKYTNELIAITGNNSSYSRSSKGIFQNSINSWKNSLSNEEVKIAQIITKKGMHIWNYSPQYPKVSLIRFSWYIATFPMATIRAVRANKGKTGPLIQYIVRRIAAICKNSCKRSASDVESNHFH